MVLAGITKAHFQSAKARTDIAILLGRAILIDEAGVGLEHLAQALAGASSSRFGAPIVGGAKGHLRHVLGSRRVGGHRPVRLGNVRIP
jgi:hypothetical protein